MYRISHGDNKISHVARTLVITSRASSGPSSPECTKTQCPSVSNPRRPARPAIWNNSLCVRATVPRSPRRLESWEITVVRAGILIPADSVSVAKTILIRLRWKSFSMRVFQEGR